MEFRVISRVKTETEDGTIFKVKLKHAEGHTLTLRSPSSEIFKGYPLGDRVRVEITKAQRTLT